MKLSYHFLIQLILIPLSISASCTNDEIQNTKQDVEHLYNAFKDLLIVCDASNSNVDKGGDDNDANQPESYTISVTSEGGMDNQNAAEARTQNATGLFSMDEETIVEAPLFKTGISFVVIQRATKNITSMKTFDTWRIASARNDLVDYLENEVPMDSVIMMSVFNLAITQSKDKYTDMWNVLRKYGMIRTFEAFDSMAFIGFKAKPGLCDRVPKFITESHAKNKKATGRNNQWTEPTTATAQIPLHCQHYATDIDYDVTVVSEGWHIGVEYTEDSSNTSLFYINDKRILGATWETGLNVVVVDSSYRIMMDIAFFLINQEADEDKFASFINSQPNGTVILLTVWNTIGNKCGDRCKATLQSLGADLNELPGSTVRARDNYSLIGYKGFCNDGAKPHWVTQGHSSNVKNSRGSLYNDVLYTRATVTVPLCG